MPNVSFKFPFDAMQIAALAISMMFATSCSFGAVSGQREAAPIPIVASSDSDHGEPTRIAINLGLPLFELGWREALAREEVAQSPDELEDATSSYRLKIEWTQSGKSELLVVPLSRVWSSASNIIVVDRNAPPSGAVLVTLMYADWEKRKSLVEYVIATGEGLVTTAAPDMPMDLNLEVRFSTGKVASTVSLPDWMESHELNLQLGVVPMLTNRDGTRQINPPILWLPTFTVSPGLPTISFDLPTGHWKPVLLDNGSYAERLFELREHVASHLAGEWIETMVSREVSNNDARQVTGKDADTTRVPGSNGYFSTERLWDMSWEVSLSNSPNEATLSAGVDLLVLDGETIDVSSGIGVRSSRARIWFSLDSKSDEALPPLPSIEEIWFDPADCKLGPTFKSEFLYGRNPSRHPGLGGAPADWAGTEFPMDASKDIWLDIERRWPVRRVLKCIPVSELESRSSESELRVLVQAHFPMSPPIWTFADRTESEPTHQLEMLRDTRRTRPRAPIGMVTFDDGRAMFISDVGMADDSRDLELNLPKALPHTGVSVAVSDVVVAVGTGKWVAVVDCAYFAEYTPYSGETQDTDVDRQVLRYDWQVEVPLDRSGKGEFKGIPEGTHARLHSVEWRGLTSAKLAGPHNEEGPHNDEASQYESRLVFLPKGERGMKIGEGNDFVLAR